MDLIGREVRGLDPVAVDVRKCEFAKRELAHLVRRVGALRRGARRPCAARRALGARAARGARGPPSSGAPGAGLSPSTATARSDSSTRCVRLDFIVAAGMVQVAASRSMSSHRARSTTTGVPVKLAVATSTVHIDAASSGGRHGLLGVRMPTSFSRLLYHFCRAPPPPSPVLGPCPGAVPAAANRPRPAPHKRDTIPRSATGALDRVGRCARAAHARRLLIRVSHPRSDEAPPGCWRTPARSGVRGAQRPIQEAVALVKWLRIFLRESCHRGLYKNDTTYVLCCSDSLQFLRLRWPLRADHAS